MPVDFTTYSNTLQARLNGVSGATSATELLLLAKASESSIGNANVSAVNAAGTSQVSSVNDAGTAKVNAVNAAGINQITAVNSAGANQITAVNNAGAAWLNGSQPIPAAVVAQIRGPQGAQGAQGPVGATFSVSGSTLTINWQTRTPSQSINLASVTYVLGNGSAFNRLNRPGGTRLWERVWVSSGYNQYVSQGYWYDPPGYYQTLYGRKTGWWDTSGGGEAVQVWGVAEMWGMLEPYFQAPSPMGYQGWLQVTGFYGYPNLWQWYNDNDYTVYYDPAPYWVETGYYRWIDTSYWAYYY